MENISEQEITSYEIGTGEVYVYEIDTEGRVVKKEIRSVNPDKLKVWFLIVYFKLRILHFVY